MTIDKFGRYLHSHYYKKHLQEVDDETVSSTLGGPIVSTTPTNSNEIKEFIEKCLKNLYEYFEIIIYLGPKDPTTNKLQLSTGGYEYTIPFDKGEIVQTTFYSGVIFFHNNKQINNFDNLILRKGDKLAFKVKGSFPSLNKPFSLIIKHPLYT